MKAHIVVSSYSTLVIDDDISLNFKYRSLNACYYCFFLSDQFVVWSGRDNAAMIREGVGDGPLSNDSEKEEKKENSDVHPMGASLNCGAIIPMVQVAGTATRRAVEATWLTASNPKVIISLQCRQCILQEN